MHARHPARDDEADDQQEERVGSVGVRQEWGRRRGSERRRRHQTGRKFCPSLSVLSVRSHNKSARSLARSLVATTERRTARQSTKTATWAVTRSHNIKTETGMLEILSERQSIPSSNVYTAWNGSGMAQILLGEAEMLHRYRCCLCCRSTQSDRTAHVDYTALSIFSSD